MHACMHLLILHNTPAKYPELGRCFETYQVDTLFSYRAAGGTDFICDPTTNRYICVKRYHDVLSNYEIKCICSLCFVVIVCWSILLDVVLCHVCVRCRALVSSYAHLKQLQYATSKPAHKAYTTPTYHREQSLNTSCFFVSYH